MPRFKIALNMISVEAREFILKFVLLCLFVDIAKGCDSNKQLYTEIGCKPIYNSESNSCPVAYDCENVFTRPSDKCYFNGNVYEVSARLSKADSALNPCLAACFCSQSTLQNKTETKFTCAKVECPSLPARLPEPCYYQHYNDKCCKVKHCPEAKAIVHECVYDGKVYKDGQRFYVGNNLQCVCSPQFDGTLSDQSCRKVGCKYELLYMKNILQRSAPVYFEKADGCPIEWYHPQHDVATTETTSSTKSSSHQCKYGDISLSVGQKLTIGQQPDSDTYKTTCSCDTPPLVTCVKVRK